MIPASPSPRARANAASVIRDELPAATNVRVDRGPPDPVRYPDQRRRLRPPAPARGLPGERLLNVERGLLQALPTSLPSTDSHLEVRVPRTASSESKRRLFGAAAPGGAQGRGLAVVAANSSSISTGPRSPVMGAATFLPASSWPRPTLGAAVGGRRAAPRLPRRGQQRRVLGPTRDWKDASVDRLGRPGRTAGPPSRVRHRP